MNTFAHDGNCIFEGTWTAITAAKGLNSNLLDIPATATHWVRYTTGGSAALNVGQPLHGNTSAATAILVAQAVEIGTAGSGDTGILFLKDVVGTWVAETVHEEKGGGTVVIAQAPIAIGCNERCPQALLVYAETDALYITLSGLLPTAIAGTNHGTNLDAGMSRVIRGISNIRNFQAINAVASNGAILHYELYYK